MTYDFKGHPYEPTGERRSPKCGEVFVGFSGQCVIANVDHDGPDRVILRPVVVKKELPRAREVKP